MYASIALRDDYVPSDSDPTYNGGKKNADGTTTYNNVTVDQSDPKVMALGMIAGL